MLTILFIKFIYYDHRSLQVQELEGDESFLLYVQMCLLILQTIWGLHISFLLIWPKSRSCWSTVGPISTWIVTHIALVFCPIVYISIYILKCFTGDVFSNEALLKPWFFCFALMSLLQLFVYATVVNPIMHGLQEAHE